MSVANRTCRRTDAVAPELPIRNDQGSPAPHDWGIGKWTTPRSVKAFVRNAKSRLMVVPSPSRPPSTSVRTAGSHSFDSFSPREFWLTAMKPVNQRTFKGKGWVETHPREPRSAAASFAPMTKLTPRGPQRRTGRKRRVCNIGGTAERRSGDRRRGNDRRATASWRWRS